MNPASRKRSTTGVKFLRLEEATFAIPTLMEWFIEEWAPWYGPDGPGDAEADLLACCRGARLPFAVVALNDDDQVLGTAALKSESLGSELGYGPWLAAVLVGRPFRGRGIGSGLIGAIEAEARRLEFNRIFVSTNMAVSLVTRSGWMPTGDQIESLRGPVRVYYFEC